MSNEIEEARKFLQRLHGSDPTGFLAVWTRQNKATHCFDLTAPNGFDDAATYSVGCAAHSDVYAAVGLQLAAPAAGSRGGEAGVCYLPGLWADIDIAGPAHKQADLPATQEEAMSIARGVGLPASIIVDSGFGLQGHWRFREPWRLENHEDRASAKSLSSRFQTRLRQIATVRGWTIDSTPDLCRNLRVPGTFNRKLAGDIRPVTAGYADWTYNQSDFEEVLEGIEDVTYSGSGNSVPGEFSPAKLPPILEGCLWMAHCRDDAASLPEPEWYQMLTVVARCENPAVNAHELSKPYRKYSRRETESKLRHASEDKVAPVTCGYVQSDLGGAKYCADCLFRGNVNSPIAIGRLDQDDAGAEQSPEPAPEIVVPFEPSPEEEGANVDASPPQPAVQVAGGDRSLAVVPITRKKRKAKAATDESGDPEAPTEDGEITTLDGAACKVEKFTDLGNAKRFAAQCRDRVRYCDKFGAWFIWDGARWKQDDTLLIYSMAADVVRGMYGTAKKIKDEEKRKKFLTHIIRSESYAAINAMLKLAKALRSIAVQPDDLDNNPWLLNVKNGTLDLKTGKLMRHDPANLMTKLAPVTYDPNATCEEWIAFLRMVMGGRENMVEFLQRAFGYCLTGVTSEKAMMILHGPKGDNGKSTMVDVIQSMLGDYALRTPVETFMKKREGAIPNDIARLKGARFVWASENERGSRLAEALIKDMTGGDKLSARFMRGEFFEFRPECKPWLVTNHKPHLRGDPAIWRRVKLVPFDVSIPVEKQKPRHEVMAMFEKEYCGILNWTIAGCLEFRQQGLGAPEEVVNATNQYRDEQDTFAMFLAERCIRRLGIKTNATSLYKAYRRWSEERGESPVSHKAFSALLGENDFEKEKTRTGAFYLDVGLLAGEVGEEPSGNDVSHPDNGAGQDLGEEV